MESQNKYVLTITIRDSPPRCYALEGYQVQIGRSENNHVTIDDEAVSSIHCEFIKGVNFPRWRFRDLGSTNGSELNGQISPADAIELNDRDEIILGGAVKLHFLSIHKVKISESLEDTPDVNPVAAAIARQGREDLECTQIIRLKAD